MKRLYMFVPIVMAMLMIGVLAAAAEELKIGAGAAPTENVLKPVSDAFEKATGIKLVIIASGPKNAMNDLEKGTVEAAAAGLSFEDWLALMKKEGSEVKNPGALQTQTIGKDKIVVIVNKANPVSKLSKEQLTAIFTGATESWKEVGGDNQPVMVVWGALIPGTNSMFVNNMLDGKPPTTDVLKATTAENVRDSVMSNPSAIGIGPMAIVDARIKALDTPEVARSISLVTKGKPSAKVQKLLDFIGGDGQKYVKK